MGFPLTSRGIFYPGPFEGVMAKMDDDVTADGTALDLSKVVAETLLADVMIPRFRTSAPIPFLPPSAPNHTNSEAL